MMNERIKELYAESVMSVHEAFIDRMLVPSKVDLQFAEFIVRECKHVLLKMMDEGQGDSDTLDQALTEINDYFGVEE